MYVFALICVHSWIQLYKCVQVDLRGVAIYAGMKVNMGPPKLGGCHITHFRIWYIFTYVHGHIPILLANRMIMKTIGGYTCAFLSIKCTFSNDLYTKPNLHEVILI